MKTIRTSTAERAGRRDGKSYRLIFSPPFREAKASYPSTNQKIPVEFEKVLRGSATASFARLSKTWHVEDKTLHARYCKAVRYGESLLKQDEDIRDRYQKAETVVNQMRILLDSFESPSLSPKWAIFILVIIGIAEFLLNSTAFAILGEGRLFTYGIAAGMGVGLPLLSHFWGTALKQENPSGMDLRVRAWAPILAFAGILSVSVIRALYFGSTVDELAGVGAFLLAIILMAINAFLLALAVWVSYKSARTKETEFTTALNGLKNAEERLKQAYEIMSAQEFNLASAQDEIIEAHHTREKRFLQIHDEIDEIIASFHFLVETYRRANLSVRNDRPVCFSKLPIEPAIPENLQQISWTCTSPATSEVISYGFKKNNNGNGYDGNDSRLFLLPDRKRKQ